MMEGTADEELIFRILVWLPVASLLRLKLVCRSWCSLIQSSHFVYQHHRLTCSKQNRILSFFPCDVYEKWDGHQSILSLHNFQPLDFPPIADPYQFNRVRLVASCNGIICLRRHRTICLWNPATRQSTSLPPLPLLPLCDGTIGFGFDVWTNDYKLVCVDVGQKIYIYSLRSDSWSRIQGPHFTYQDFGDYLDSNQMPINNNLYCWTLRGEKILSFDFSDEVFRTIPLPPNTSELLFGNVFELRQKITVIGRPWTPGIKLFQVWMLNGYDVKASWTKLYSIDPISLGMHSPSFSCVNGYSKRGECVIFRACGPISQLLVYDLVTQKITKPIDFPSHFLYPCFEDVMYDESLVSVKRGNGAANVVNFEDQNGKMLIDQLLNENDSGDTSIPEDLVLHILLWLPVVSLLRFKSVCKSWCSLIKSSYFVSQHLLHHHLQNDNDNTCLILSYNCFEQLFEDSSHSVYNTSWTCLLSPDKIELLDLPCSETWNWHELQIKTSFNGIICLTEREDSNAYLWNPATKQFKVVLVEQSSGSFCFGFGFDEKTNDYKLVRFGMVTTTDFEVYNLSTDLWRIIKTGLPAHMRIITGLQTPYRSGIYCWLAQLDSTHCNVPLILYFDFTDEVFGTIPLPDDINKSPSSSYDLSILRKNVACISTYFLDGVENWQCEIWMMNKFGISESWTKLYNAGPFSVDWHLQMGYSKKNRDYLLLQRDGQLYMCDLFTQETIRVPVQVQETIRVPVQVQGPDKYQVVLYKESLVPITKGYC